MEKDKGARGMKREKIRKIGGISHWEIVRSSHCGCNWWYIYKHADGMEEINAD